MIETAKTSGFGLLLIAGALAAVLFLTSCGKKEAAPAAAGTSAVESVAGAPELPVNVPRDLEEFKDPKGAFVVMLPKGFVYSDKTVADKLKYIFTYGSSVNLILTQGPAAPEWDSAAEMTKKQDEIRTGRAGFPPAMVLVERGLLAFGGLKGFQTLLGGNLAGQETQMTAYYLVGEEKLFTLIVTWKDPAAAVLYGQVKSGITNSFRLASFNPSAPVVPKPVVPVVVTNVPPAVTNVVEKPAPVVTNAKPVEVAEPVQPVDPRTEPEWAAARAMLKFTGSMKMGGQQVAMVNDKILRKGDTISVTFHDKEFVFIVMIISPNGVEYKRQLNQ
jgi:hypothetical protein